MWLTNGIPAMQQALFQPDPLAALLDDWFLVAQMRHYFARAAEHGMPPHLQELATGPLTTWLQTSGSSSNTRAPTNNLRVGAEPRVAGAEPYKTENPIAP